MNNAKLFERCLIILSDETEFAHAFEEFAQSQQMTLQWLDFSQLTQLSNLKPTAVVISPGTAGMWDLQAQASVKDLFSTTRVFGMGQGGADLFACLQLSIGQGNGAHFGPDTFGVAGIERLPPPIPHDTDPLNASMVPTLYSERDLGGMYDINAIYDNGSPQLSGFEGIARYRLDPHYWPICKQGSYVYWAFDGSPDDMSKTGRALLHDLLAELIARPIVPLQDALVKPVYLQSGVISAQLTAETEFGHRHHIRLSGAGNIVATVTWHPPEHTLAVIFNGPGRFGGFEREDGSSPLSVSHEVTAEEFAQGTDWRISIKSFRKPAEEVIAYHLDLSFPG